MSGRNRRSPPVEFNIDVRAATSPRNLSPNLANEKQTHNFLPHWSLWHTRHRYAESLIALPGGYLIYREHCTVVAINRYPLCSGLQGCKGHCGGARATFSNRPIHADAIFGDVQMLRGTCTSLRQTGAGFLLIFDPPIECFALFFTLWTLPPLRVNSAGVDGTRCDQ